MTGRTVFLSGLLLCGLSACDLPHTNAAIQGDADGVIINYAGDIAETQPLARQHCARYERVPVLWQAKENTAVYRCLKSAPS